METKKNEEILIFSFFDGNSERFFLQIEIILISLDGILISEKKNSTNHR